MLALVCIGHYQAPPGVHVGRLAYVVAADLDMTVVAEHDLAVLHLVHAHGHVVQDVAQVLLALAQHLLHVLALADVLHHRKVVFGLAFQAQRRDHEVHPHLAAVLAAVALFHAVFAQLTGQHPLQLLQVRGQVAGLAEVLKAHLLQFLRAVAQQVAELLVHAHQAAGARVGLCDTHRSLVEHGAQARLAFAQGRIGLLGMVQCL